jgi:hypothetical protein
MKNTALASAVVAVLIVIGLGGPALAQNRNNFTNINTFDSPFFGFVPTVANINTFMQKDATSNLDGLLGTFDDYIKNGQMPGAYTQRPDQVVSVNPDFGCGAQVATYSACDESTINIEDRVNGNTTTANLAVNNNATGTNTNGGNGQNTAPTSQTPTGGGGPSGVLVGDLTSEVYLESTEDGMPSGSIVFHRTDGSDGSIEADFDQLVSLEILNFQTFSEHDRTENDLGPTNFAVIACPAATCTAANFPNAVAGQIGSRHSGVTGTTSGSFAHSNLGIRATLSLSQAAMGGDGTLGATESIGYTVDWQGNGTYPTPGAYYTPGLNVGDWTGSPEVDTNGF